MPVAKDPRKAAADAIWAEYGRAVRDANFARDKAIRAALEKRNDDLAELQQKLLVRSHKEAV